MTMIAAIYTRSSKERRDVSCSSQEVECRAYIQARHWRVGPVYTDPGISSTRDVQEDLGRLMADAKAGMFQTLVVYDTARFGRDQHEVASNLHHLERKCGITVHFVKLPATGEPMDLVIRQIVQSFDTMHSIMSAEGARRGQRENIRRGYKAGGSAPYGYRLSREQVGINPQGEIVYKSRLALNESQAAVVAEYFERRGRGESRVRIASDFTARGLPTPRGSARWHPSTLRAFEENHRVYLGQLVYGRHNAKLRKEGGFVGGKKFRDEADWLIQPDVHPAIVGEDTVRAVLALRRSRRGGRSSDTLLGGLLDCGLCDNAFWGCGPRYACSTSNRFGPETCQAHGIPRGVIESIVKEHLVSHVLAPSRLESTLTALRDFAKERRKSEAHVPRSSDREVKRLEAEIGRLLKLYAERKVDEAHWLREYGPRQRRLEALRAQERVPSVDEWALPTREELVSAARAWADDRLNGDPERERSALRSVYESITLGKREGSHRKWRRSIVFRGVWWPAGETEVGIEYPRGYHIFRQAQERVFPTYRRR